MTFSLPSTRLLTRRIAALSLGLTAGVFAAPVAHGDGVAPPAPPALVLPLQRNRYFTGETILVASTDAAADHRLGIVADGATPAGEGKAGRLWTLDTLGLAPAHYQFTLDGTPTGIGFDIISPDRPSPAALVDEVLPMPEKEADKAALRQTLAESGINALMGVDDFGTNAADDYAANRTMYWLNPYTRPISFTGARVYEPEVRQFRQRLAQLASMNDRYPNFGGFLYEWDPCGFFARNGLLIYWAWGGQEEPLRKYIARSTDAIYADFTKRTGLIAPTTAEYLTYAASSGHPEFGPAFDLPTYRWIQAIAKEGHPMSAADQAAMEKRLAAWTEYLNGIYGESYAGYQAEMRRIDPSLANTASVDMQGGVREGQWQERAYAPLDFRHVEAWDDQTSVPNYPYQWLLTAGLVDMGRHQDQPLWVASSLGTVFGVADYPGKFLRVAAHDLAYGGRGLGFALEGFSNVLGGMNKATNWDQIKGKAGEADLVAGREFLNRFAPMQAQTKDVRQVGLFLSLSQYSRQSVNAGLFTPQGRVFLSLARLGYTPRNISEEDLAQSRTAGLKDLIIVGQTAPLPAPVMSKIALLQQLGCRVFLDKASTIAVPGAIPIDIALPFKEPGRPFNWSVVNTEPVPPAIAADRVHAAIAAPLLAALGNAERAALVPLDVGAATHTSVFALDGGFDARYVVAVDDATGDNPARWERYSETLAPNGPAGTIYDATDEKELGPTSAQATIPCDFNTTSARLFAITARPIGAMRLQATQRLRLGQSVHATLEFDSGDGRRLNAAIPFSLTLAGTDGTTQRYDRSTNAFGLYNETLALPASASAGTWKLTAHCRLNGLTQSLPFTVDAAEPVSPQAYTGPVIVRGTDAIEALLKTKPTLAIPVFPGAAQPALMAAALQLRDVLAKREVTAEVIDSPTLSTYVMAYDPTPAEIAENDKAERGKVVGKIHRTTINENDYFAPYSGYVYNRPVILLDLVGTDPKTPSNPMASAMAASGMLWPKVDATFPGPGRAIVQIVPSAFWLGTDAIVIQATDAAGLTAGIDSLARLPADPITTGIRNARGKLLHQFSIGTPPIERLHGSLSADGVSPATTVAEPLALDYGTGPKPPTIAEAVVWKEAETTPVALPATLAVKDLVPYYQPADTMIRAWNPGGNYIGDLRFVDGLGFNADCGAGDTFHVAVTGKFRYSDRLPRTQASWEPILAIYNADVPKVRHPITADIMVDGKIVGSIADTKVDQITVPIDTPGGGGKPNTVTEEGIVEIDGTIALPAGVHQVMVVPRNVVDGQVTQVSFGR